MTNFVSRNQEKHINVEKEMTQPEQSSHPRRGLHWFDPDCLLASAYPVATTVKVSVKMLNDN